MGSHSQIPTGNDRSRTNWTMAMESYFIDLLLDQVHRGNRMGHTFNKQAWNEMLAMFNANFGSSYDINVLKSRYTCLWTQFNDIKNLLDQNGFSWDKTRQMVIASNHVWDAYIKAHPDVQVYRNKVLVNINDLCLIYAHTSADGRYSLSSHDVDFDDDFQGVNTGFDASNPAPVAREHPNTDWTLAMDCYFLKLMLDQHKSGNKIHNTFNRKAWKLMHKLFNKQFDAQYDKSFLKHRYKKLRNYYFNMKDLLEVGGFFWDEKQQRIVADDDAWDNYIKAHPHVSSYRNKTLLNYEDLGLIYGSAICNGHCSHLQEVYQDNQDPSVSAYLRTDWTPSMDRYLLDLMLQDVRRGNKIDYALNGQVWINLIILFQERFGVKFDIDFLKNCCKCLETLYHGMRNLLEYRGFSWDEMHQKVIARDKVWDAYIKEHPDANFYRNRRKPNYNDLCLTFGDSAPQWACNLAGQDVAYNGVKFQNSDPRNDWTPPMDRYFIDLMLEEVCNGSMVEYKFDKLAWRALVAKFSAEFGSQYNKEVLKSQFIILRDTFNDMKALLDHNGFVWDEMCQMITADDGLWDAYVKEHPDVKMYRSRTLPNFNDLSLIYGNTNCGRNRDYSSFSSHVVDNDSVAGGEGCNQSLASGDPLRMAWTVNMDHYLIGLLLEQFNRGNKTGDTFSKKAWVWMTASFNKEFGLHCDKYVLEDRYLGFLRVFKDMKCLLNQNGIAWDDISEAVRANEVWEAYFEDHPNAIGCGETVLDNYSELCLIVGNLNHNKRPGCEKVTSKTNTNYFGMETDEIMGDLQLQSFKRKSGTASTSSYARKVQGTSRDGRGEDSDKKKPKVMKTVIRNEEEKDSHSIESIVGALETVPDMDDELFLEACVLLEDERKAKMFVAMDTTARRKWLLKNLYQ